MRGSLALGVGAISASVVLVGCAAVLGLDEFESDGGGGSAGTTNPITPTSTTTTTTGGSPTGTTSGNACMAGETEPCAYGGPPGTEGKGICQAGKRACVGGAFGACMGEQQPLAAEDCTNSFDDDCNGQVNDTCPCEPNSTASCYSGPAGTDVLGICHPGTQTCNAEGTGYGPCMGEQVPASRDDCGTPEDENCDGVQNDACACVPATTEACYTFDAATRNVGNCRDGSHACLPDGSGYEATCTGESGPGVESCTDAADEDCNGVSCSETKYAFTYGQGAMINDTPGAVAFDAAENLWFAGQFGGTIDVGGQSRSTIGGSDILLVKYALDGTISWFDTFGSVGADRVFAMAERNGVLAVLGTSGGADFGNGVVANGLFLATFDAAGTNTNTVSCGGAGYSGAVKFTSNGDIVVAAGVTGTINCGISKAGSNSIPEIFVSRFQGASQQWASRFAPTAEGGVTDLLVDTSDNLAVAGYINGNMTFGASTLTNAGGSDAVLLRLAGNTGMAASSFRWGDTANQVLNGVALASDGDYVIAGSCKGTMAFGFNNDITCTTSPLGSDGFLAKLTPTGVVAYAYVRHMPAVTPRKVALDAAGNVVVAGGYTGTASTIGGMTLPDNGSSLNGHAFAARLNPVADTAVWARGYKTGGITSVMTIGASKLVGMGGFARGTINLGLGDMPTGGNPETQDMYVFAVGQ